MTIQMPPALANNRKPNHPGGLTSFGMVHQDTREPGEPPIEYDGWSALQQAEWNAKHFSPREWTKARENMQKTIMTLHLFFPFFGMLVSQLFEKQYWVTTEREREMVGKNWRTMATDGRTLYIWPQFALYHTLFELLGVVLHELFHNLYFHLDRGIGYDRELSNIAMDYVVNGMVNDTALTMFGMDPKTTPIEPGIYDKLPWVIHVDRQLIDPSKPEPDEENPWTGRYTKFYYDPRFRNPHGDGWMLWEEVYHILDQERRNGILNAATSGEGCTIDGHGIWVVGGNLPGQDGKGPIDPFDRERVMDAILDAHARIDSSNIGSLPGGVRRHFDRMINPPLPWDRLLAGYLKPADSDIHFAPGDLRFPEPMPWMFSEPKKLYAFFGFDLSGSMDEQQISEAIGQARVILKSFPGTEGWALFWDATVHDAIKLDDFDGKIDREGIHGGGGTSIKPQFMWAQENGVDPRDISIFVSFTDGYVHWGEVDADELVHDVIWVITNDHVEYPPAHYRYKNTRVTHGT